MTAALDLAFPSRYFVRFPTTSVWQFLPTFFWETDILPLLMNSVDFKAFRSVCRKFYLHSHCFTCDPLHPLLLFWDAPVFVGSWKARFDGGGVDALCPLSLSSSLFVAGFGDENCGQIWSVDVSPSLTSTLVKTLKGHTHGVNCICALPGHPTTQVITSSTDKTLKIWNVSDGSCVRMLEGHTHWVMWVCVVPSSRAFGSGRDESDDLVASGSWDDTVKVWNWKEGKCIATLRGHKDWVRCVIAFDSQRILSCSDDNTIKLWDLNHLSSSNENDSSIQTYLGHTSWVLCLCLFDQQHFVSGSSDKTVKLWHIDQPNKPVCTLEGHEDSVRCVQVLEDYHPSSLWLEGRKLILSGSNDHTVRVWVTSAMGDLSVNGECVKVLHVGASVWSLVVLENRFIVCGDNYGMISMWDVGFPSHL